MPGRFRIEALGPGHNRKTFCCGVDVLDRYFRELVTQDVKRRLSNCFVACSDAGDIAAFYTFAATSLPLTDLAADETKRLPRYGVIPAGLIGRLAVDKRYRGQRLGSALIVDAVRRAAGSDPAIFAIVVDAKDDAAIDFYAHLGFRRFESRAASLYLPLATALKAINPM